MSAEVRIPAPLGADFGWALRAISLEFRSGADQAVAGLPSGGRGYLVLLAASEDNGQSQLAIARRLGVDKTVMTYLVDALVAEGLVQREPDPSDRRIRLLVLTDAGRTRLDSARAEISAVEERLLSALTGDDAQRFRSLLATIAGSASAPSTECDAG